MAIFNYEWFHRGGLESLIDEARDRCALKKHPGGLDGKPEGYQAYRDALETRVILYLKDGLTYEMREICSEQPTESLVFECVPVDESYRVGAIVLSTPFEDIARVEVFAVHPDEKPQENIRIPGFRSGGEMGLS